MIKFDKYKFGTAIGLIGLLVVAYADWIIAIGLFLTLWGNNIQVEEGIWDEINESLGRF